MSMIILWGCISVASMLIFRKCSIMLLVSEEDKEACRKINLKKQKYISESTNAYANMLIHTMHVREVSLYRAWVLSEKKLFKRNNLSYEKFLSR